MKKLIIAGASTALVLAAIPLLSSSADTNTITDRISLILQDTCDFERTSGEGNYTATIMPGTYSNNFASSTFTVTCNDPDVYTVTAEFTDLTAEDASPITYDSTTNPNGENSTWVTKITDDERPATNVANGAVIMTTTLADGGSTATVRYSVGASSDQDTGTYTGHAIYTMVSGY